MGIDSRRIIVLITIWRRWNRMHPPLHRQRLHGDRVARRFRGGDGGSGRGRYDRRRGAWRRRLRRQRVARRRLRLLLLLNRTSVRGWRRLRGRTRDGWGSNRRDGRLQNRFLDLCTLYRLHYNRRLHRLSRGPRLNRRRASHPGRRASRLRYCNRTRRSGGGTSRIDP